MSRKDYDDLDRTFEDRASRYGNQEEWSRKFRRFVRYLSTRKMECWGFFAAGFLVATIL